MAKRKARRSPLKAEPLRQAGQSVQAYRWRLLERALWWPFLIWFGLLATTFNAWQYAFFGTVTNPWLVSMLLLLSSIYLLYRVLRLKPSMDRLKMAYQGEQVVGEFLDRLRADGYQVFHDIVGDNFNIDHVLIGPTGIYSVETKTYSKPENARAELEFDGHSIRLGQWQPSTDAVIQARAQSGWLRALLQESTGKDFDVFPVILFPGWFVKSSGRPKRPIWVLNPKALPEYLKHRQPALTSSDIRLASYHLSRSIRADEKRNLA